MAILHTSNVLDRYNVEDINLNGVFIHGLGTYLFVNTI